MNIELLIEGLVRETTRVSLPVFGPELALCGTIVVLMLARLTNLDRLLAPHAIAIAGTLVSLGLAVAQLSADGIADLTRIEFFTGLLVYDGFTLFFRLFLLTFLALVI